MRSVFKEPHNVIIEGRIYRKSDSHYWTFAVSGYPTNMLGAVQQVQAWACGLSIHPNFDTITVDSVKTSGEIRHFEQYTDTFRDFLDEGNMNDHVQ